MSLKHNLYALKGEERVELSILVLGAHGANLKFRSGRIPGILSRGAIPKRELIWIYFGNI